MLKNFFLLVLIFFCFSAKASDEYFLTLRHDKVNLRQGPTFEYPIKIYYKKKFLPVLVQDKSDNFRKIRDHENNTGWIHISQLSKKKAAITIDDNVIVFNRPTIYSSPKVLLKKGRLCLIKRCKDQWCKIETDIYSGWVKSESLWGRL
tara:strand:+ start:116 stop:559 length:444 start_codon:yes stop_codon:yes gene_type:complete